MLATYGKRLRAANQMSKRCGNILLTFLRVNLNSVSGFEKSLLFVESGLLHRFDDWLQLDDCWLADRLLVTDWLDFASLAIFL